MKLTNRIFRGIIALKNKQIKLERERSRGYKETNDILAAYLALLVEKHGSVRVPKELIRETLECYRAFVGTVGDDYVITVEKCDGYANASNGEITKANDGYANASNGEITKANDGYAKSNGSESAKVNEGMTSKIGDTEPAKVCSGDGEN